jgi:hypothetical protein
MPTPFVPTASSARKNISIPLATPLALTNGDVLEQLPVRENQTVLIAVAGLNRSPALWGADAAEWRPERWLADLPESVLCARVPGVYSNLWVQRLGIFLEWRMVDPGPGVVLCCLQVDVPWRRQGVHVRRRHTCISACLIELSICLVASSSPSWK